MKKKNLFTLCALLFCGTSVVLGQTAASEIKGERQILYSSEATPTTPYRIPAIATMSNNEVIAIADYRPCGADVGNGDVDIYARISNDNGVTWSGTNTTYDDTEDVIKIADGGTGSSKGYGDAAVAADLTSGKVVVMCVGGGNTIYANATINTTDYLCIRNYSDDYGRTWKQSNVTSFFKGNDNVFGADVASMFFGSGKLAVSKKVPGRIYGALLVRQGKNKIFNSYISYEEKNYVVYSDDWGATWNLLGDGACCTGGNEPKVEELPNGDILLSSRASGARYFNVFTFTDKEKATGSWGTAISCSFSGSNSTNGEILLYQGVYLANDQSGTKYNVVLQSIPTGSSRSNVSVYYKAFAATKTSWAVSDFTSGWIKGAEVDDGASAYSTMTILPNGQIGFLYEDNYDTSKAAGDYSDIVFVPITMEEMTDDAYTTVAPIVQTPAISPNGGTHETSVEVNISCATTGASIYYTVDGTVPTAGSTLYEGTITLTESCTLNAFAVKDGFTASEVATATFTITQSGGGEGGETPDTPDTPDTPFEGKTFGFTALEGKIGTQACGMATFSATVPTTVPAGVTAYYVRKADENIVTLSRISRSMAIPANEGVILMAGSAGDYVMTEVEDGTSVAELTGNMLVGTCDKESTILKSTDYVLALKGSGTLEGQFAFCLVGDMTVTQPANRAYLQMESGASQVRMMFDGNETSVDDVLATPQGSAEYYDLTGRRVKKPAKGVYVVKGQIIVEE